MTEKPTPYDPAEDLTSAEAIAAFLAGAFETNDADFIAHALDIAARSEAMKTFERVQAANRLTALGGTMPDMQDVARKHDF